jgi:LL-diaminopimelate aminotransferase
MVIASALEQAAARLQTTQGYTGYGPEQGIAALREKIAARIYNGSVAPNEIFVSDGAKCDLGRLQMLFGRDISIAVQDPAYPVYNEGSLIQGVQKIVPLPCLPENSFFPCLETTPRTDLIYFCSPNNPTGAVATRTQLENLVAFARANRSVIIYDAAYAAYIRDPQLPLSIFEIEGARQVAIEINSFSKIAGFTGVRLGWTVVPNELVYDDGASIQADWNRLMTTVFNGASNIAQAGGIAILEDEGWQAVQAMTAFYQDNTTQLHTALTDLGYRVFGGIHAPYLWLHFPGCLSWDIFQHFLEQFHIVTTPGSGFGPSGEGYLRLSAFGHRKTIVEAIARLRRTTKRLIVEDHHVRCCV